MDKYELFQRNTEHAKEVCELLKADGKKIASAESCTGGLLATFLTEEPGSSLVYMGGINCYSNESKIKILSVPPATIETKGAVSKEVAVELARNVCRVFNSDFGLGVTGIAGPDGGSEDKPVGTVWCAIHDGKLGKVWCLNLKGERHRIRMQAAESVLMQMIKFLKRIDK